MCSLRCLLIVFALLSAIARGQSPSTDQQTLQALLAEVRQLRLVLQTTALAAQSTQIALHRLEIQGAAVARATKRLDDIRLKLMDAESAHKRLTVMVENLENLQNHTENQQERLNREIDLRREKKELEIWTSQEQQLRALENEASAQVQAEQTKLSELEDALDKSEKSLQHLGER